MVHAFLLPDFNRVPANKTGVLKRCVLKCAPYLLSVLTGALFRYFTVAGDPSIEEYPPGIEANVEQILSSYGLLASHCDGDVLARLYIADTFETLVKWQPARAGTVNAAATVLRSGDFTFVDPTNTLLRILVAMVGCTESCVARREIPLLSEIIDLLEELPLKTFSESCAVLLGQALVHILRIPSILFADRVTGVLIQLDPEVLRHINVGELLLRIRLLLPKNQFHPTLGTIQEGVDLTEEQCGSEGFYTMTFGGFRNHATQLLEQIAVKFPSDVNEYILTALSQLPDPAGTPQDPRTQAGHVTQKSDTYLQWETTCYMVDHLSESFKYSPHVIDQCFQALLSSVPKDAVLLPLFYNMLLPFWKCPYTQYYPLIWPTSLNIIFAAMSEERPRGPIDPDEAAARRRAFTLFVSISTNYNENVVTFLPEVVKQCEALIIRLEGFEANFIYEAMSKLLHSAPEGTRDSYLRSVLQPLANILTKLVNKTTRKDFCHMLIGTSKDSREDRNTLKGSLETMVSILRGGQPTRFTVELIEEMSPILMRLITWFHDLTPADFPPEYADVLTVHEQTREGANQLARRNEPKYVNSARLSLVNIRQAVFQLLGGFCGVLQADTCLDLLRTLCDRCVNIPVPSFRTLKKEFFDKVSVEHPQVLRGVLQIYNDYFRHEADRRAAAEREVPNQQKNVVVTDNDIFLSKQWLYLCRDVVSFMRTQVLENKPRWQADPQLLAAAAQTTIALFETHIDEKGCSFALMEFFQIEMPLGGDRPDLVSTIQNIRGILFAGLVRHVVTRNLLPSDRENLAFRISEPYLSFFPDLGEVLLGTQLVSYEKIEELHAQISLCGGHRKGQQRQRIKEFL
ncbi:hypothetical protein AGDE_07506 [Angomonas deanei]|uniref:Uncharacterized protein n=1 Tax=Angomonas deanei TaxID=59799 RepID=A0A7G2BYX7_9TRYP|nr:hypothetical protein AGDE_07506 [Angomonas deanei]CAD2212759.1 hypothetical protein, conserved [Angomonas deanei]|eukprot:EPY35263.1 hypothetical protein AGDE_07506 [Angomonas deanei]